MLSLLLAACSGPSAPSDDDGDGFDASVDCDDGDPFVHPEANEFCDGRDDDCDGVVDGPSPLGTDTWYTDADGDQFGDPAGETRVGCDPGDGWSHQPTDCDDADPARHPSTWDGCDGVDDDCNGIADDNPELAQFVDADGDGHGDPDAPIGSCEGSAPVGDDCDDTNPLSFPGAEERCDGEDNDCDYHSDAIEATVDPLTWYADLDRDGYGIADFTVVQCVPPTESWALVAGDCDDLDPTANPGALQLCTVRDTDCDGIPGDDAGWWDPAWPIRIPMTVTASADSDAAAVTTVVDFRAALDGLGVVDPFDPATLVVVVQDCAVAAVPLPTAFVDGLGDPFAPAEVADPLGDERGLVTFRLDRPLDDGQTLQIAAYLGGPPVVAVGGVLTTGTSIGTPAFSATFDPDRAGTLDALTVGGVRVISQGDAREGNGIRSGGGWTQLGPATVAVVAESPVFGAIAVDGVYQGPAGPVRYATWWFGWDGSSALFARILLEAAGDLAWSAPSDVRPFEAVPLDLVAPTPDSGPGWASLSDAAAGVAVGWVRPPLDPGPLTCDVDGCRVIASEGQTGAAVAGERVVDERVLALVPLPAGADPSQAFGAILPSTSVSAGGAQVP